MEKELATNVWAMSGFLISYSPGILILNDNKVSFITKQGEQFNVPLSEVKNAKWPKLQMGYGVHIEVNGKKYKLTFIQPTGENALDAGTVTDLGRIANGLSSLNRLAHLKDYKANANEWRALLGG